MADDCGTSAGSKRRRERGKREGTCMKGRVRRGVFEVPSPVIETEHPISCDILRLLKHKSLSICALAGILSTKMHTRVKTQWQHKGSQPCVLPVVLVGHPLTMWYGRTARHRSAVPGTHIAE